MIFVKSDIWDKISFYTMSGINYQRLVLLTDKQEEIPCWVCGNENMTCRILLRETVTISSNSSSFVPIRTPGEEHDSGSGLVEPSVNQNKVFPVPGIIHRNSEQATILVHNNSDDPITLHIIQSLGTCTSYTDSPPEATVCIRAVQQMIAAPFCQISLLTYCNEVLSS